MKDRVFRAVNRGNDATCSDVGSVLYRWKCSKNYLTEEFDKKIFFNRIRGIIIMTNWTAVSCPAV